MQQMSAGWVSRAVDLLWRRSPGVPFGYPAPVRPLWIVGDLHGRLDLLERLFKQMAARTRLDATDIVLAGDYIDRGPDSAAVLSHLYALSEQFPNVTCLMGNHERMLLDFCEDPVAHGLRWLRHGGRETLASYGLPYTRDRDLGAGLNDVAATLQDRIGPEIMTWLRMRPLQWRSGNIVVVHAALDPGRAPEDQLSHTQLWGHSQFFNTPRKDGVWVAHGHTIVDRPGLAGLGRIAVDTGAYETGRLTGVLVSVEGVVSTLST